ncbi:MAG: acylneuraminate cytidylyltransferase family protein [Candidatus Didemnitutus sp.]|nr:acylneuraminate cytidylyltransferase family protein [Candidatus Didemnitutus sp.]
MLNDRRILAVVPARGGSKGVKNKNIHPLLGRPLIAHTAELIAQLPWVDRAVVSTDSDLIATTAEAHGLAAPFRRPESIAGDRIGDWDVLNHALLEMERQDACRYDTVLMLQPTGPLRRAEHVEACARKQTAEDWDAVWTVTPIDLKYHPLKQLTLGENGATALFDLRGRQIIARQQLTPTYYRNGACYALSRSCILDQKTTMGQRWAATVIEEVMVSIDTLEDFALVEQVLRERAAGAGTT